MQNLFGKVFLILFIAFACQEEGEVPGKGISDYCACKQIIATSNKCSCNISFSDYLSHTGDYTYVAIESSFYEIGPPCNQNVFRIKYTNSVHDHNEPDYEFSFHLPVMSPEEFFTADTFAVDTIGIFESQLTGGHGGPKFGVDVTLIWDSVSILNGIYWGSGKFIFNDSISSGFPNHFWPEQEVRFEFCKE